MLLVETFLAPSEINGIGLFSKQFVKKGTPVWSLQKLTTQIFNKEDFLAEARKQNFCGLLEMINYSYVRNGMVYYLNDNTKFINHSSHPNIMFFSDRIQMATQDIYAGEEITENYHFSYDSDDFFHIDQSSFLDRGNVLEVLNQHLLVQEEVRRVYEN